MSGRKVKEKAAEGGVVEGGVGVSEGVPSGFNGKILVLFDQTLGVIETRVRALKASGADVSTIASAAELLKPKRVDLEEALKSGDSETVGLIIDVLKKLALKAKEVQERQKVERKPVVDAGGTRDLVKVVAFLESKVKALEVEAEEAEKERDALKAKLEASGGVDIRALMRRVDALSRAVEEVDASQIPALKADLNAALGELRNAVSSVKRAPGLTPDALKALEADVNNKFAVIAKRISADESDLEDARGVLKGLEGKLSVVEGQVARSAEVRKRFEKQLSLISELSSKLGGVVVREDKPVSPEEGRTELRNVLARMKFLEESIAKDKDRVQALSSELSSKASDLDALRRKLEGSL